MPLAGILTGKAVILAVAFAFAMPLVQAGTFYVATNGSDGADGSSETPFATIAKGVDAATQTYSPRKVVVRSGTYMIDAVLTINAAMTIESETGNPADVIIDGQGRTSLVKTTDWGNGVILSGITLQNGYNDFGQGANVKEGQTAGIYMFGGMVTNCVVKNCFLTGSGTRNAQGAGIFALSSKGDGVIAQVVDTHVFGNVASNDIPGGSDYPVKGAGIYMGNVGGIVRGCTVENNVAWMRKGTQATYNPAGYLCSGGGIFANGGCEVVDCIISGNMATNACATGYAGSGGGIYAGGGSVISNCLVCGNMASAQGGGIQVSESDIIRCTITNNTILAVNSGGVMLYGAGVCLGGANSRCVNSRVEGNSMLGVTQLYGNTAVQGGGGIALITSSSGALVADCTISDNVSHHGGALLAYAAPDAVVSNCLIKGNSASKNGGAVGYWRPQNVLITDCVVVSNTSAGSGAISYGNNSDSNCRGITFRNSFFFRNRLPTAGDGLFAGNPSVTFVQPLKIEYCTVVSNESKYFIISTGATTSMSNVFCRGNVFFANRNVLSYPNDYKLSTIGGPTGANDIFAATTNAWYNFTDVVSGLNYTDETYGNYNTVAGDWFTELATGDYRLVMASSAHDKGGPVQDWMGSGLRNGPSDMGDGTMTVVPDGGYGIDIVRNNALPRLKKVPEPGCFELWFPVGIGISFK